MLRRWVTYFESSYAAKGLAMIASLHRHARFPRVTVLACDDMVPRLIRERFGPWVRVVKPAALEKAELRLAPLRAERSGWEYLATLKPVLLRECLRLGWPSEPVAYIDSDTFFFSDPEPLFREAKGASVVLSPHRFHPATEHLSCYGPFNAGFGIWRNDPEGRRCLGDWASQCLDWCRGEVDAEGRFMNQGYLAKWPQTYERAKISSHPGSNLGPWNLASHRLRVAENKRVLVDEMPLVFYHFSSLWRAEDGIWETYVLSPDLLMPEVIDHIYAPYLLAVEAESCRLRKRYGLTGFEMQGRARPTEGMERLGFVTFSPQTGRRRWETWKPPERHRPRRPPPISPPSEGGAGSV